MHMGTVMPHRFQCAVKVGIGSIVKWVTAIVQYSFDANQVLFMPVYEVFLLACRLMPNWDIAKLASESLNIEQEGLRRFWSMFPLTRVPIWYRFLRHSHTFKSLLSMCVKHKSWEYSATLVEETGRRLQLRLAGCNACGGTWCLTVDRLPLLDCYWVGSLDCNFLGNQKFVH